jgi:hypothetical protein
MAHIQGQSPLVKLPAEIVDSIVSSLSTRDILNIRLASAEIAGKSSRAFVRQCLSAFSLTSEGRDQVGALIALSKHPILAQSINFIVLDSHFDLPLFPVQGSAAQLGRALSRLPNLKCLHIRSFSRLDSTVFFRDFVQSLQCPRLRHIFLNGGAMKAKTFGLLIARHWSSLENVMACVVNFTVGSWTTALEALLGIRKYCVVEITDPKECSMDVLLCPKEDDPDADFVSVTGRDNVDDEADVDDDAHEFGFITFAYSAQSTVAKPDGLKRGLECMLRGYRVVTDDGFGESDIEHYGDSEAEEAASDDE